MCKLKLTILIVLAIGLVAATSGCDSYAQKKEAAYDRWEKTTAKAKIPLARDMFLTENFQAAQGRRRSSQDQGKLRQSASSSGSSSRSAAAI